MKKVALIAGTTGVVGRALLEHLETAADWDIVALSRCAPDFATRARFISVDLADRSDAAMKLADLGNITHVFYAAYAPANSLVTPRCSRHCLGKSRRNRLHLAWQAEHGRRLNMPSGSAGPRDIELWTRSRLAWRSIMPGCPAPRGACGSCSRKNSCPIRAFS